MVAFAAQEAYLMFGSILVHVLTLLRDVYTVSHPIILDLTLKVK